jgi:hypothetical protein
LDAIIPSDSVTDNKKKFNEGFDKCRILRNHLECNLIVSAFFLLEIPEKRRYNSYLILLIIFWPVYVVLFAVLKDLETQCK